MEIRKMKLSELTPAEYNPRVELKPGDQEWEALDESIDNFGYVEPQGSRRQLEGHRIYRAGNQPHG